MDKTLEAGGTTENTAGNTNKPGNKTNKRGPFYAFYEKTSEHMAKIVILAI